MNHTKFLSFLTGIVLVISGSVYAQHTSDPAFASITSAELRDHIYFLASDYLQGRVATSPEYQIAAQYVAAQFKEAGLQPAIPTEDGGMSYFQGVPFAKTSYKQNYQWTLSVKGKEMNLLHEKDFKILMASNMNFDTLELVWIGYGISEPDHKWDDLKGLDIKGKIVICMGGAPTKRGKPVLPEDIHEKYMGQGGFQSKIMDLFSKEPAAVILMDPDGTSGRDFDQIPSSFSKEKVEYKGGSGSGSDSSYPSIYLVKNDFLEQIGLEPTSKPQLVKDALLSGNADVLNEEVLLSNNVVGMVPGTDPILKNEYIVVSSHLDHVRPVRGEVCNGADDNASGSAGVMEIAEAIAMNPCKRSVIFITCTAEEMGLLGSKYFVNSDLIGKDQIKFDVNLDMIGRSDAKNEESRAHYVRTAAKYLKGLETLINQVNDGVTDFPLIYNEDEHSPGGSDHMSFIQNGIPGFFFFSGMYPDLHQPGDDAEKIDYAKAASICQLSYLLTRKLGNMETVPGFTEE